MPKRHGQSRSPRPEKALPTRERGLELSVFCRPSGARGEKCVKYGQERRSDLRQLLQNRTVCGGWAAYICAFPAGKTSFAEGFDCECKISQGRSRDWHKRCYNPATQCKSQPWAAY